MNRKRRNLPIARPKPLIDLGVLIAGILLTDTAAGADPTFSLYKSTNDGASWSEVGQGLPSDARINALVMAGKVAVAGTERGVFLSQDAGERWQPPPTGLGTESRVLCFAAHAAGRVFAGTHKHGVLFSDDEGMTWKAVNQGLTNLHVRSLLDVGPTLYAGTDSAGVFVSEDAGASWTSQRAGLPDSSQVFDLAAAGGTVFAALYSNGLYRWEADRARWAKSGDVVPLELVAAGESLVVGHNPGGVFVSGDLGKSWQDGNLGLPINAPIWNLAADGDRVLVGTTGNVGLSPEEVGLFASDDRGKSWTSSDAGLPPASAAISFVVTKRFILAAVSSKKPEVTASAPPTPAPANVRYGDHERQVLDVWKAESAQPTPVVFFIHGGGWVAGDKAGVANLEKYLAAGISVVSINYRYATQAQIAGVKPPVEWPLGDAARALQFVRSKAAEWNLDKARIAASGGSAGACSSLWLAFHHDLADPTSTDPVARESTRLWCAAVTGAQTTLDPQQMKEWTPNSRYGGHAFGFMPDPTDPKTRDTQFAQFLAAREQVLPWIKEYSPIEHVSPDDPPIYMIYAAPPALGQDQKDPTHTANFGVKLQEKLRGVGARCELVYPGAPDVKHPQMHDFLIETLKAAKP